MPWDEVLLAHEAAQEVEAESGLAATIAARLTEMLAGLMEG